MTHVNKFGVFILRALSCQCVSSFNEHNRERSFDVAFIRTKKTSIFLVSYGINDHIHAQSLRIPFAAVSPGTSKTDPWTMIKIRRLSTNPFSKGLSTILFSFPEDLTVPSVRRASSDSSYSNNVDFNRSLVSVFSLSVSDWTRVDFSFSQWQKREREKHFLFLSIRVGSSRVQRK